MKEANVISLYVRVKQYRGAMNDIAERASCNRNWVRMVLKGMYYDDKVIQAAIEVVKVRDARKEMLFNQINTIATATTN